MDSTEKNMEIEKARAENHQYIAEQLAQRSKEASFAAAPLANLKVGKSTLGGINSLRQLVFGPEKILYSPDFGGKLEPNPSWKKARRRTVIDLPSIEAAVEVVRQYFAQAMASTETKLQELEAIDAQLEKEISQVVKQEEILRDEATSIVLVNEQGAKKKLEASGLLSLRQEALKRKRMVILEDYKKLVERQKVEDEDCNYGEWCLWEQDRRRLAQEIYDSIMYVYDLGEAYKAVINEMAPLRKQYTEYNHNGGPYSTYAYNPPEIPSPEQDADQDAEQEPDQN